LLLLITGKPPGSREPPVKRGAIRAAVGDWLAASRHAGDIAAVRGAHQRHGGAGALYIVLRRRK
jgi:DNA-nicking Smr family endonuclease